MNNILLTSVLSLSIIVTGCATSSKGYPNKSFIADNDINTQLATETVNHVKSTKINNLKMEVNDNFGSALYQILLAQKVNVEKINPLEDKSKPKSEKLVEVVQPNFLYYADTVNLVDDNSKENSLYRIVYQYNYNKYSKLFSLTDNKLNAVSNWSVRGVTNE